MIYTQSLWRSCSREEHGGRVARSDFVHSHSIVWLTCCVAPGLSNAGFTPYLKFGQPAWHHLISPTRPWATVFVPLHNLRMK